MTTNTYKAAVKINGDEDNDPIVITVLAADYIAAGVWITRKMNGQFGRGNWTYEVEPVRWYGK